MDKESVKNSLNFHGQQLAKLWESERGAAELEKLGAAEVDYSVYQERAKHLSLQERGKRLALQRFVVRRAEELFETGGSKHLQTDAKDNPDAELVGALPPYELFVPLNKQRRAAHFFRCVQNGELLVCSVANKLPNGFSLKVLCSDLLAQRYLADLNIRAFLPATEVPGGVVYDKKGQPRQLMTQDTIRVLLLEVLRDAEKLFVTMASNPEGEAPAKALGLIFLDDLPEAYKPCVSSKSWQQEWNTNPDKLIEKSSSRKTDSYADIMESSVGFNNPSSSDLLEKKLGINQGSPLTMMKSLKNRFQQEEYGSELRKTQNAKWAMQSVNEGILHFKAGRASEAFQCLNSALSIDPVNVEGLVARGALFANNSAFTKAIDDFEMALKVDPDHSNAKTYLAETLVAYGRQLEDDNKFDQAVSLYNQSLTVVPYHKEAIESIRYLENKLKTPGLRKLSLEKPEEAISVDTSGLLMPGLASKSRQPKEKEEKGHSSRSKKKKDRKKKKSKKRRHRSSSTSSSSSSASSSSSSSSTSSSKSSSGSDSDDSNRKSRKKKKEKKHQKEKHEKSLSPFTKKLLMDKGISAPVPPPQPMPMYVAEKEVSYQFGKTTETTPIKDSKEKDLMDKVKLLIAAGADEEKLRKLFDTAPKSKEKEGKKKKKKEKKQKEKGKKKKDDKKLKKKGHDDLEEDMGASVTSKKKDDTDSSEEEEKVKKPAKKMDLGSSELGDLSSKLSAYYAKMEEKTGRKRSDAKESSGQKEEEYGGYGKAKQPAQSLYSPEANYVAQEEDLYSGQKERGPDYVAMPPSKWDHPRNPVGYSKSQAWGYEQGAYEYEAPGRSEEYKEASPMPQGRFAGFRINKKEEKLEPSSIMMPDEAPPSPPAKQQDNKGRSRSRSRSRSYSSRGSGGGRRRGRGRSGSRSRSRSGSYRRRSRSRSYSRSRSRSGSYDRRRRWVPRRGTFYKPAFRQNYTRPFRGRFNRRPFRPFNNRGRGRFFFNRRRYSRSRSRSDERRSYDRDRHHSSGSDNERRDSRRDRDPSDGRRNGQGGGYSDREMDVPLPPGPPPDAAQ